MNSTTCELVTIGMPVINESARLVEAITSVREQTYPNIELCISDNCSEDDTYELAQKFASEYKNIRVIRQLHNRGFAANFDAVRRMGTGAFFMWLSADDSIHPTFIERMVDELKRHPHAAVAHSGTHRVDQKTGATLQEVRYIGELDPNSRGPLRQAMQVLSPSSATRKQQVKLYLYGLYHKPVLDMIMDQLENPLNGGDHVLPALAALSGGAGGGLRYVDDLLFTKCVNDVHFPDRWPDDPLFSTRRRLNSPLRIVTWVWRCKAVPIRRRWYGVIITLPFIAEWVGRGLRSLTPQPIKRRLKNVLSWLGLAPVKRTNSKF